MTKKISIFLILFTLIMPALYSCGIQDKIKEKTKTEEETDPEDPSPPSEPSDPTPPPVEPPVEPPVNPQPDKNCAIDNITDPFEADCTRLVWNQRVLFDREISLEGVSVIASRKNGGQGGTLFFNATALWSAPTSLQLPDRILVISGKAGKKKKVYVRFNETIDCAWMAKEDEFYENPRCFIGATRDPNKSDGFNGGQEVDNSEILDATKMEITVNGSSGNGGTITTVKGVFNAL